MPDINSLGNNNPLVQQNQQVDNVNQAQHAGGSSVFGRVVLGIATIGLSELVRWCRSSDHPAPARNLNMQLPAISPANKRANAELAVIFARGSVPHKYVDAAAWASVDCRRVLPVTHLTDGARSEVVRQIRNANVKVTPEILASMMKQAVLSDYLQHQIFSGLVREQAAHSAQVLGVDPAVANPIAYKLAYKSNEVKALAQNVNFKDPQQLETFKQNVAELVREQISICFTLCSKIKDVQARARASMLEATGLEDNENFQKSVNQFLKKIETKLLAIGSNTAPDPEKGVCSVDQLPDIAARALQAGADMINEKRGIIDLIRQSNYSDAVRKEWAEQALIGGAFFNQSAARNALNVAGNIAYSWEAHRLIEVMSAAPIDAAALKSAMVDLFVRARTDLATLTTSEADKAKYDGEVMRHVGILVFGAVLDSHEELRTLFHNNQAFLAQIQGELINSTNAEEFAVAQSVFETVHSKDIGALYRRQQDMLLDGKRRDELLNALALPADEPVPSSIANEFVGAAGGRRLLIARFGEDILPGANLSGRSFTLTFESENEKGFMDELRKFAREHEGAGISYGAVSSLYQSFVLENHVTNLLEAAARPIAQQLGAQFLPDMRAFYRNPEIKAQFEAAQSAQELNQIIAGLDNKIRALIGAEKTLVEKAAVHYDGFVSHLAARSGLSADEVKSAMPLAAFAHELCRPFYTSADGPAHSLEFARAAEAAPAKMGQWLTALTAEYDTRFDVIEHVDVPMATKIAWRRDVVLTKAFNDPRNVTVLVATAPTVDVSLLLNTLPEAGELSADELANVFRFQMRHISDKLMSRPELKGISPEELHGLRKALVALLFSRESRLQNFFGDDRLRDRLMAAVLSLDEDRISARIDEELAGTDPQDIAVLKASELANARECSVFFEASQPGMKAFAESVGNERRRAAARAVEVHNAAVCEVFEKNPLSAEIQNAVNRMTADLRTKFGEAVVPAGELAVPGIGLHAFLWNNIRLHPAQLDTNQALDIIRERLIEKFVQRQVLDPILDTKREAGLCSQAESDRVQSLILNSALLKKLANDVVGGNLEPMREALRGVVDEQLAIGSEFAAKKTELSERLVTDLAQLTGKTVEEVREHSAHLEGALRQTFDQVFDAKAPRNPETGLIAKEALPGIYPLLEEKTALCIASKHAVFEAIQASHVSDGLKNSFTSNLLSRGAVFPAAAFTAAVNAGRAVADMPQVTELTALFAEGGEYSADRARELLTQISANLFERLASGLSATDAAQLDSNNIPALLADALAVVYELKPELAAGINRDFVRTGELQLLLKDLMNNPPAGIVAGCVLLQPDAVSETGNKFRQHLEDERTKDVRQALRKALFTNNHERDPIPQQFVPAFENAMTRLRARLGEAVIPLNAKPLQIQFASEVKTKLHQLAQHAVSNKTIEETFVQGVTEAYVQSKLYTWSQSVISERGQNVDATALPMTAISQSSRIRELIAGIERPEDIDAMEQEARGILSDMLTRKLEIDARSDAAIEDAQRRIAEAGDFDLEFVKTFLTFNSFRHHHLRPELLGDITRDPRTGQPDKAGEAKVFADALPLLNEQVTLYSTTFKRINELDIPAHTKREWCSKALSGQLFLAPGRITAMVNAARALPAQALEDALRADPANPVAVFDALKAFALAIGAGISQEPAFADGDAELYTPARLVTMTLFAGEHEDLVRLMTQEKKNFLVYTLQTMMAGEMPNTDALDPLVHIIMTLMQVNALGDVARLAYGAPVAPPDWIAL